MSVQRPPENQHTTVEIGVSEDGIIIVKAMGWSFGLSIAHARGISTDLAEAANRVEAIIGGGVAARRPIPSAGGKPDGETRKVSRKSRKPRR